MTQALLGVGIVGSLTAVASWIAFGPGLRAFAVTLPLTGRGPGDETLGRAVFGTGAKNQTTVQTDGGQFKNALTKYLASGGNGLN